MLRTGYVNGDGFTSELSPGYHRYPFIGMMRAAGVARRAGIDFYREQRFKAMFDLPLKIMLPDLTLPRLNDGGSVSLASEEWVSLYEEASSWYGDENYLALLNMIYRAGLKRNSIAALLHGRKELPPLTLILGESQFLPHSGAAMLRSPLNDWNLYLKNDRGESGHRHPDALNMLLFANGEEAFPGTGSPLYGDAAYLQWYTQTIAHNTLTLNTASQRLRPLKKAPELGLSHWGVSAAQAAAEQPPALLRRTLVMTPRAIVDIFRVTSPETVSVADWTLHLNGALSADAHAEKSADALIPADRLTALQSAKQYWPHQGYKYLTDLMALPADRDLHATLTQPKGGKVDIWLAPAISGGKLYRANGPGIESGQKMPLLLQRREELTGSVFTAVYAPYQHRPTVRSVRFLTPSTSAEQTAVEITHQHGKDLILSAAPPQKFSQGGATLDGALGCEIQHAGGQLVLLRGREWKSIGLEITLAEAGEIIINLSGSEPQIHNAGNQSVKGIIKINGREKTFATPPAR
jgi:hypothetical protein